ncbi:hypothetical protein V5O48_013954 [Marasmius crinis-equi]|uniref:NodB homology domain-containing protein n=1 Tax=Marasmius crinis-equi TaxID=585013 RepID=A0ABR3EYM3_9AGAR
MKGFTLLRAALFCAPLFLSALAFPVADLDNLDAAKHALESRDLAQVFTSCKEPNTVALTFDDGPYDYILELTKTLEDAGAKGTFFFNGNNWRCIYNFQDQIKQVYAKGHQVANHVWEHDDLTTKSWDELHDLMWKVEQALQRIVGVTPAFIRPPYGNYNDLVRQVASARGQSVVTWDYDSQDAVTTDPPTADQRIENYRKLIQEQKPSNILTLNHEVKQETVEKVIPQVVQWLKDANYRMVTVAECLGMEPYQKVESPATPDSSWTC